MRFKILMLLEKFALFLDSLVPNKLKGYRAHYIELNYLR